MVEERSTLDWVALGYEPLEDSFRHLASADAEVRAAAAQHLFETKVQEDTRYLVRSYVVVRYIQLLSHPNTDKYDLLATLAQLSHRDESLTDQDNHRIQSLLANNDSAFTPFLNVESLRDYVLEIIGNLHHYADRFVPLLFTSFSHDDPSVVYTLARLITKEVQHLEVYIDFFQANLISPDPGMRTHAAVALAKLLNDTAPPLVENVLLQSRLYIDIPLLAEALSHLGQERAIKALFRKLEEEKDRDRMFMIVLYVLSWSFEAFPNRPHYTMVPSFFHPKDQQKKSTLDVTGFLMRGWLLDKFPGLRKTIFRNANARAKYVYFVNTSETTKPSEGKRRQMLTQRQIDLIRRLLGMAHLWHYQTNVFELFGLPNTKSELKWLTV